MPCHVLSVNPQAMYLTRRAELAEAAALISPLELPPTMRSAATPVSLPHPLAEPTARGRHTSAASNAGSTLAPAINLVAGTACQRSLVNTHDESLRDALHVPGQKLNRSPDTVQAGSRSRAHGMFGVHLLQMRVQCRQLST